MYELLAIILKFISIVFGGILAGFIGSLTGLGGGTVLVPLLSIFYGVPIVFATGASLISTIATSAGSASAYTKEKIANIKIGVGLEVATTIGAVVGSLLTVYLDHHALTWLIYVIFGIVLLGSLVPAVKRGQSELPPHTRPDWTTRIFELSGKYHDARLKKDVDYNGIRWWLGEIIMFFAAVIPIMKLLVVVVTFIGRFIAQSIPKTLRAPLPIPKSPDTVPAKNIIISPSHHLMPL